MCMCARALVYRWVGDVCVFVRACVHACVGWG